MYYPITRLRRLRQNENIRNLVSETNLKLSDLIMPYFVVEGKNLKEEISSMPGIFRFSIDNLILEVKKYYNLGIKTIILFGIPTTKNENGTTSYLNDAIIPKTIKILKDSISDLTIISDICLCSYTLSGHCGIIDNGKINNDKTLEVLGNFALECAKAGCDIVAPSDMMDGRVGYIRKVLDSNGYADILIMSYSIKYASSFYGPFRDAADCSPKISDRKTYQMDFRNKNEALREAIQDINEGADILMVKPALSYLDIISFIKDNTKMPICAYNVSGEYSMVKASAFNGWIDEKKVILEILTSIKRSGSDIIISYHTNELARWLNEGSIKL